MSAPAAVARCGVRAHVRFAACVGAAFACSASPAADAATANDVDAAALRTSQLAIGQRPGDLVLTDAQGRPLELARLRGRPLVLSLVFTNCYAICSGLTLRLRDAVRVARDALGPQSFTVLTVGFDTAHDTPARMRAYARDRGIADPGWYFAAADEATIRQLADSVGFTWVPSAAGFDHVAQVTLLDRDGTVARQLYGTDFEPPALVEPLRELVLGERLERASVADLITRVRLYCSVYDAGTGRYRFDYAMLATALPALLMLGIAAFALVLAGRRKR